MSRLNDTAGIKGIPLKGCTTRACPDDGGAVTARRAIAGMKQYSYMDEKGDEVEVSRPHPNAGSESLRGATMYLGKKLGNKE